MINRPVFYAALKPALFTKLNSTQVQGMEIILNEWEASGLTDLRWLGYMMATVYHECAKTMQPIKEFGNNAYFVKRYWDNKKVAEALGNIKPSDAIDYCGKGFVQITGRRNYQKMGKILGYDLLGFPNLVLQPDIATKIMFEGMTTGKSFAGDFTGKHLGNYFNKTTEDPINARRIINGLDCAKLISKYWYSFNNALKSQ